MKVNQTILASFILSLLLFIKLHAQKKPVDYINPFIGASTSAGAAGIYHGLGKTFPGATTPYGLVQVSPNTITGGDNGPAIVGINYREKKNEWHWVVW